MEPAPQHEVTCYGEILWDILPTAALPGGAPMNVAYHLKKLGTHPALITRIGKDDYGKRLLALLAGVGISTAYVQQDADHATGLVYATPGAHNEVAYDIVFPSAWDFIEWRNDFKQLLSEGEYFIFGSLAARNKESRDTLYRLLEVARTKVLDINLRPPHFEQTVLEHLLQQATILKMNSNELELLAGRFGNYQNTEDQLRALQDRYRIETLIVTRGGEGALVWDRGTLHRHAGFRVPVADTIGSGDAFLAGFIHQKRKGVPVEAALEFACGLGAFIATRHGACPSYELPEVDALINANATAGH